jgi:hypothetical protein
MTGPQNKNFGSLNVQCSKEYLIIILKTIYADYPRIVAHAIQNGYAVSPILKIKSNTSLRAVDSLVSRRSANACFNLLLLERHPAE